MDSTDGEGFEPLPSLLHFCVIPLDYLMIDFAHIFIYTQFTKIIFYILKY